MSTPHEALRFAPMLRGDPDSCDCASGGCGCADTAPTPATTANEPGRSTLGYRVGTAGTFLESMRRSAGQRLPLRGLHTRGDGDASTALMDAWSCVLDVLTFYSERAVQEGYLRTAVEEESLTELARTVGYERGPGRASTTWLAFTLEEGVGTPPLVPVPAGTKVASRPGPGEMPQTYETLADTDTRPTWNAIRPLQSKRRPIQAGDRSVFLAGVATDLRPGDWLLVTGGSSSASAGTWALRPVTTVTPLPALGLTRVEWDVPLAGGLPAPADQRVHALRLVSGLFGATAPDWRSLPQATRDVYDPPIFYALAASTASPGAPDAPPATASGTVTLGGQVGQVQTGAKYHTILLGPDDWPGFTVVPSGAPANTVDLDGAHPEVVAGGWLVLMSASGSASLYRVASATLGSRSDFAVSGRTTRVTLSGPVPVGPTFGRAVRTTVALARSDELPLAGTPVVTPVSGSEILLDAPVPALAPGRALVLRGPHPFATVSEARHRLDLVAATGAVSSVYTGDVLEVTGPPTAGTGATTWPVLLGDLAGTVVAADGDLVWLAPPADAVLHAEVVVVDEPAATTEVVDSLRLTTAVTGVYDRGACRILANVALSSHGETKQQVLGSGDGTQAYQRFRLAQAPLTYVSGRSSLVVRVDGVAWTEVPALFGHGPNEHVYTVRLAADDTVTVEFGDGVTGARLPTGVENVTATYRVGTGLAGVLPPGRLELLMTRPLGVRSVTNPLPTGLAADPDDPAGVRALAPLQVLTLGRVVSVTDYEDLARQTAGIAKASAAAAWQGVRVHIQVTVAGEGGQDVGPADRRDLEDRLRALGAGSQDLAVVEADAESFDVTLTLFADPARAAGTVAAAVRACLLDAFGFSTRALRQPVTRSEVSVVAQQVPGVVAVTVLHLALTRDGVDAEVLPSPGVLTVSATGIHLTEVAP